METTRIGIIGDFNPGNPTHVFTNHGIEHAAEVLVKPIEAVWLPTDLPAEYGEYQGLFGSPGSPYMSFDGALTGIRYARENKIPFIGTCGGSQHLMIEYARNVMGLADAAHAESDPYASCLFVTPLSCSLTGRTMQVTIKRGSKAAAACQAERSMEAYYCNFGLNPEYQEQLERAGLEVTGKDENGEARIVELGSHPFFVGTLFVPQARSEPGNPHPLILAFCRAATAQNQVASQTRIVAQRELSRS
jgi:CTP synthase (UTP-ammonia lyase)